MASNSPLGSTSNAATLVEYFGNWRMRFFATRSQELTTPSLPPVKKESNLLDEGLGMERETR